MCDNDTIKAQRNYLDSATELTRRHFHKISAGIALAAMFPPIASAQDVVEQDVLIDTPDGQCDAYYVHPANGKYAAVLIWPDIMGLRTAFKVMGKRLAESGYTVLVVNPFYRGKKAPILPEGAGFDESTREVIGPLTAQLNANTHFTDARAFVSWLDQQPAVDTTKKIGTTGYCMGGPIVMRTAAAVPDRVGAGATFHGGGLVSDGDDSPHLLIPQMKADFLIAIAASDDSREPEAKNVLKETFAANGLDAEVEVYEGTEHGWCPIDSRVYHAEQAERAWSRMMVLFEKALA